MVYVESKNGQDQVSQFASESPQTGKLGYPSPESSEYSGTPGPRPTFGLPPAVHRYRESNIVVPSAPFRPPQRESDPEVDEEVPFTQYYPYVTEGGGVHPTKKRKIQEQPQAMRKRGRP